MKYTLIPVKNVIITDDYFVAATDEPILRLHGPLPKPGTWFEIQYSASYLDHLVRPLIYFEGTDEWEVMQAPYFGKGRWTGYYPKNAKGILISPTNTAGNFRFLVNNLRNVFLPTLYIRAFIQNTKTALISIGAGIIGTDKGMRQALMFARGGIPLKKYHKWREHMLRPYDKNGIDAPYHESCEHPHLRIIIEGESEFSIINSKLWKSLIAQQSRNYSIAYRDIYGSLKLIIPDQTNFSIYTTKILSSETEDLLENDILTVSTLETIFHSYTIECLRNISIKNPSTDLFYGDFDELDGSSYINPSLLPDWSPRLHSETQYINQGIFCRIRIITNNKNLLESKNIQEIISSQFYKSCPFHIRRILTSKTISLSPRKPVVEPKKSIELQSTLNSKARVSIIIPSKNRIDLIEACLISIQKYCNPLPDEIIIIDNDSNDETLYFYSNHKISNLKVIHFSEPFNFSRMCNIGAEVATGEILIFMNNDVEALHNNWLPPLISLAMQDNVGVVAPLLVFPNSSIQHAGIIIGMGGFGDHIFQGESENFKGYLRKLMHAHEVSAVTGAVMVVKKSKFFSVGKFDDLNFPIELSDVDLCLRLNEAGDQTILNPLVKLLHRQSTTRGFHFKPFDTYRHERYNFKKKWREYIRDDKYFHPAICLFSTKVCLS